MGRRQPRVQAFTRSVQVWKQDCGARQRCAGYERRCVLFPRLGCLLQRAVGRGEPMVWLGGSGTGTSLSDCGTLRGGVATRRGCEHGQQCE